jgi:hypothetical protein
VQFRPRNNAIIIKIKKMTRKSRPLNAMSIQVKKLTLALLLFSVTIFTLRSQVPIYEKVFGQNVHFVKKGNITSQLPNELDNFYDEAASSGVKFARIG